MRIAFISREYPPQTGWGGIGTYVHRIAHALAALGHEVHVITRSERLDEYTQTDGPVTVHRIREHKWRWPGADGLYHRLPISEWFYSRRVMEKTLQLHREKPFDVAEAPEYRAEASHLIRAGVVPVIVKLHTPTYVYHHFSGEPLSLRERFVDRMERSAVQGAAAVSSPSADLADSVLRTWDLPRQRVTVIPNPADPSLRGGLPWPAEDVPPTLLYIGRVARLKGVHVLGEAVIGVLQEIPHARFVLVGAPGDRTVLGGDVGLYQKLQDAWRSAGVLERITLVPWQKDPRALHAYYRQSHVVAIPSLYDNFPNVCLEAMATGRAVVASDNGGFPEIITPGVDGELVRPGDARALRQTLMGLLNDLPCAKRLGEAARRTVSERFDASHIAQKTTASYARVAEQWVRAKQRRVRVLAISTERWINWHKDEGVAIVVPEFMRGLERDGMVTRLIRRPYQPKAPARWGRSGWIAVVREGAEILWDVSEVVRNIGLITGQWLRRPTRFDLIWVRQSLYGLGGWTLSWLTGRPLVLNVDAPLIEEYEVLQGAYFGHVRRSVARWVLRRNLARARAIHVPSQVLADWLARDYGVPSAKLHVVPNGVHLDTFGAPTNRRTLRQRYGLGDEPVILFLGSLQPWHGCEVLLEAFTKVRRACPDAKLLIVGDGKVRGGLVTQAAILNLNGAVQFMGQVPHRRVPELLAVADVAVLPYPTLPLPFYFSPIKLFEYMGAGKAIVASRIGQIAEVLQDGRTGRLVTPGSVDELAQALAEVVSSPDRGAAMGEQARAAATAYTWERQGALLARICREVLEQQSRGQAQRP